VTDTTRFVVLGLGAARSAWFGDITRWANSGAVPGEFIKCLSVAEVRVRLRSPRPHTALLIESGLPGLDRDLLAAAHDARCAVIVVGDPSLAPDSLGIIGHRLTADFDRTDLLAALRATARRVAPVAADDFDLDQLTARAARALGDRSGPDQNPPPEPDDRDPGLIVAVTGSGGTGASLLAMGLAQALADSSRPEPDGLRPAARPAPHRHPVLLADLRRAGQLAMLHDCDPAHPGVQELAEAHRRVSLAPAEVRALGCPTGRGYPLLPGLRQVRMWPTVRPAAFRCGLDSLAASYGHVVADIDSDFEGEAEGGSVGVEDRNAMSRISAMAAAVIMVIGLPTLKGIHSMTRVTSDLVGLGVAPDRIVAVVNRSPRHARERARLASALADLIATASNVVPACVVFVPELGVEGHLRDGTALPAALGRPLIGALRAVVARTQSGGATRTADEPLAQRIQPGSIGVWAQA